MSKLFSKVGVFLGLCLGCAAANALPAFTVTMHNDGTGILPEPIYIQYITCDSGGIATVHGDKTGHDRRMISPGLFNL